MKRLTLLVLMCLFSLTLNAQKLNEGDISKYLEGAVTLNSNGLVEFSKTYKVQGKDKMEIYQLLKNYTKKEIVEGENHLEQARITELDSVNGVIAASIEEWLYFKKKNWVTDATRFFYQLVYQIDDEKFTMTMRRIHYIYEDAASPSAINTFRAEEWITDKEALVKSKTKLHRISGKFRKFTIDRKDEIFNGAAKACGIRRVVKKTIEVEAEEVPNEDISKYLEGAVILNNSGFVEFSETYEVKGKNKQQIFNLLKDYTQKVLDGKNHLEKAKIMETDINKGLIVANIDEWLYFRKESWVTDRSRFSCKLTYQIADEKFTVTINHMHYVYEEGESGGASLSYNAEELITDEQGLNKAKTNLHRIFGKFRKFTIDRKDEIFHGAAKACGIRKMVKKTIEVEEDI